MAKQKNSINLSVEHVTLSGHITGKPGARRLDFGEGIVSFVEEAAISPPPMEHGVSVQFELNGDTCIAVWLDGKLVLFRQE
jgi:hypothetical protein